jgi:DNA polymerase III epsilon subunit-like protein
VRFEGGDSDAWSVVGYRPGVTLRERQVLVVDAQATGASPQHGHLLEIGWLAVRAGDETPGTPVSSLVALPDGAEIPPVVRRLTGLSPDDLSGAPTPAEIWARLCAAATEVAAPDGVAVGG